MVYEQTKSHKNKRTSHLVDSTVPIDHRIKVKENEKIYKYQDLAREQKNRWNMKVTVMPNVVGALSLQRPRKQTG